MVLDPFLYLRHGFLVEVGTNRLAAHLAGPLIIRAMEVVLSGASAIGFSATVFAL